MKLWRKMAMKQGKKDGVGPGRRIKHMMQMEESFFKNSTKTYPLLMKMFVRAGIQSPAKNTTEKVANEAV